MVRRPGLIAMAGAALVAGAIAVVVALAGDGDARDERSRAPAAAAAVDRFDLERQVELGPRPAGSRTSRRLAERLRRELPGGRFERIPGHPGLRNVVGRLPGAEPALVVAAHYDSKDLRGFVGANDGAAGAAAVVEIARALQRTARPEGAPALRFVLFDGEEATDDRRPFARTGLRGSKAYAKRHRGEVGSLILLDFVAAKDLEIRREASSDPVLWGELRRAARAVGAASAFPAGRGGAITDDHTPFLAQGVPAIDLIQWPYACWHKPCDDMTAVSERSLDKTGETVVQLVRTLSGL
jgi:hypothetical protein